MLFLLKRFQKIIRGVNICPKRGSIILLGGKAGSGKDVVADYLCAFHGYKKLAFADALKEFVSIKYSIDKKLMYSQEGKQTFVLFRGKLVTVRNLLIAVATNKRKFNEDLWVNIVIGKIENEISKKRKLKIVISDFRFENEYTKIYQKFEDQNDIHTILIKRDGINVIDDPSETSLDVFQFDQVILNNSSKTALYNNIEKELDTMNK